MKTDFSETDSIFFDMDGTLWDAMSSYCKIWDICFEKCGLKFPYTEDDVRAYMGYPIDYIFDDIVRRTGVEIDRKRFLEDIENEENMRIAELGGILYEGVAAGISQLSERYKLFMVSNCSRYGLKNFMKFSNTTKYFTDSLSFGQNRVPKSENIKILIDRHKLAHSIYVGDTQGDCDQTHRAGIPFVYASYGFGKCDDYDMKVDSFIEFVKYFSNIKK